MIKKIVFFIGILMLAGCKRVHIDHEFNRLNNQAKLLLDEPIEHGTHHSYLINEIACTDTSHGLSRDNAVTIALRNNPYLQAEFENLGIAKADLEQAGLFTNPTVDGIFAVPTKKDSANPATALMDVYATMRLSDLWVVPLSKNVAQDVLEITSLNILSTILTTVSDTKNAYDNCLFTKLNLDNAEAMLEATKALSDEIYYQQNYGYTTEIDKRIIDSKTAELDSLVAESKRNYRLALMHLNEIMGLNPNAQEFVLVDNLEIAQSLPTLEAVREYALNNRPEILVAHMKIEQYKDTVRVEKAKIFKNVNAGISFQQDFRTTRGLGPAFILDVPIFDSNYAQIAKAEFLLAQACEALTAVEIKVKTEIEQSYESLMSLQKQVQIYQEDTLPMLDKAIDYGFDFVDSMQMNAMVPLQTNITYYEQAQKMLELKSKARKELVRLERATGKKLVLINKTLQENSKSL